MPGTPLRSLTLVMNELGVFVPHRLARNCWVMVDLLREDGVGQCGTPDKTAPLDSRSASCSDISPQQWQYELKHDHKLNHGTIA